MSIASLCVVVSFSGVAYYSFTEMIYCDIIYRRNDKKYFKLFFTRNTEQKLKWPHNIYSEKSQI